MPVLPVQLEFCADPCDWMPMDLFERAKLLGVETRFVDGNGQQHRVDEKALGNILDALPEPTSRRLLQSPLVVSADENAAAISVPDELAGRSWRALDQHGAVIARGNLENTRLEFPALSHGVFDLKFDGSIHEDGATLISAPGKAYAGDFDRVWLLAVQLYSIKSDRNWGIGDFTDLAELLEWAKRMGAAGVGLNPLHALFDNHPADCSPYSPNSRMFLNPLYIDVAKIPEFPPHYSEVHKNNIEAAQRSEFVDYVRIAGLKQDALRETYRAFQSRTTLKRKTSFDEFRKRQPLLSRFACFEHLRRTYSGPWWDWPDEWNRPNDAALQVLRNGPDAQEIEYVEFVQWCAHEQLQACTGLAKDLKLPIGLYLDVAVGVKADGFDAWNEQRAISRGLSVGAPPDLLNTAGQNWGLAGFNAVGLELTGFSPFRDMLRASMQYAGAIRLDHVLGLNRLYLVPSGYPPDQGVYVQMPFEGLLAITAIESVANRCVVIGEDLGTVPNGFRENLAGWAIWSYRVMMFERDETAAFRPAGDYPPNSLVTFNTHDLPTFSGWKIAHDIDLKHSLGIDPGETREARSHALEMLAQTLGDGGAEGKIYPALGFLARTGSRLLAVSIEDLLEVIDQPNIPGTIDQHPNWRRRLPCTIEAWDQHIDYERLRQVMQVRSS